MRHKWFVFLLFLILGWGANFLWQKQKEDLGESYYKNSRDGLIVDSYFRKGFGVLGTYDVFLRKFKSRETGDDYYRIYKEGGEKNEGIEVVRCVPFRGLMYTKNDKGYYHIYALNETDKTSWEMTGYEIVDASGNPFFNRDSFQPGTGALKPWEIKRVFVVEEKKRITHYAEKIILHRFFGIPEFCL